MSRNKSDPAIGCSDVGFAMDMYQERIKYVRDKRCPKCKQNFVSMMLENIEIGDPPVSGHYLRCTCGNTWKVKAWWMSDNQVREIEKQQKLKVIQKRQQDKNK